MRKIKSGTSNWRMGFTRPVFFTIIILFLTTLATHAQSMPKAISNNGLPDRPGLPARPKQIEQRRGGHIRLKITPEADVWTEVEWLDGAGEWHLVDGWRGFSSTKGEIQWFVTENDLGKGPFRWQIYLFEDGDFFGSSEPFFLPAKVGDVTITQVDIPEIALFFF